MKPRPPLPIVEIYRGVGLHDAQDEARLAIVRADVDEAFSIAGQVRALSDFAANRSKAPESRLLAAALVHAEYELAIDERRARPDVDLHILDAVTAGLGNTRHKKYYDSMFSAGIPPGASDGDPRVPVRRPQALSS